MAAVIFRVKCPFCVFFKYYFFKGGCSGNFWGIFQGPCPDPSTGLQVSACSGCDLDRRCNDRLIITKTRIVEH